MIKKIGWIALIALIVIQFIRPAKNVSAQPSPNDITKKYAVPENVQQILAKACNDCHSNNSAYPWYYNIQPVGMWMAHHINEGKRHLNFSEFATYSPQRASHKLGDVSEEVTKHRMPISSYLWEHPEARLTDAERKTLSNWADSLSDQIKTSLPGK